MIKFTEVEFLYEMSKVKHFIQITLLISLKMFLCESFQIISKKVYVKSKATL